MQEFRFDLAEFIPFRDVEVCRKVRRIRKEEICSHSNSDFKVRIIDKREDFYFEFALDIVGQIKKAKEKGKRLVLVLPAGPIPQ